MRTGKGAGFLVVEINPDEPMERRANLKPDEIPSPMASVRESALLDGRWWTTPLLGGMAAVLFVFWVWFAFLEPRLHWFGPRVSKTPSGEVTASGLTPAGRGGDFHGDPNLIKSVQSRLNQLGFRAGSVDGVVGPRTMEALERFQMSQGLPVTGVIDLRTKESLDRIELPKAATNPYMVARARREDVSDVPRFIVDLSMDPSLSREAVEKYVRLVALQYARSNPDVKKFHVRGYLGIASLSAGAYAIAEWDRKGKDDHSLEGLQIRFQEWVRKDVRATLPSPDR